MAQISSYRDLDVWQAAMDLVISIYDASKWFPRTEQFELVAQMRRAAVSVPSNIAEGHATGPGRRYRNHVRIALGSLAELATQLEIAARLKYLEPDRLTTVDQALTRTRQLLHGLHRSLRRPLIAKGTFAVIAVLCAGRLLLS